MQDGNIGGTNGTSQESFEVDLSALEGSQVVPEGQTGSDPNAVQSTNIEVDPEFVGLPQAEGIARTMQRKHDKLYTEHQKIVKESEQNAIFKEIMDDLYQSDDALYALLSERKPELVQQRDVGELVRTKLIEEFGEGYEPEMSREEAERKGVGSKDWRFYRRQDSLWQELSKEQSYGKFKNLKEYRESVVNKRKEEDGKIEMEIAEAKQKLQASDAEVDYARKWAADTSFENILRTLRIIRKMQKTPVIGNVPGTTVAQVSPSRANFIKSLK